MDHALDNDTRWFGEVRAVARISAGAAVAQRWSSALGSGTPFIVSDGVPRGSERWSLEHLVAHAGGVRGEVWVSPGGAFSCSRDGWRGYDACPSRTPDEARYVSFILPLREVVARIHSPRAFRPLVCAGETLYWAGGLLPRLLRAQLDRGPGVFPPGVDSDGLWISQAGALTTTHYDQRPGVLAQIRGVKQVVLVPNAIDMAPHDATDRRSRQSRWVDLAALNVDDAEHLASAPCWACELGPGDALMIPPLVWHQVRSMTNSISLTLGVDAPEIAQSVSGMQRLFGPGGLSSAVPRNVRRALLRRVLAAYKVPIG